MTKAAGRHILLTGFEAFDHEPVNPTQKLLKEYVAKTTMHIDQLILPVSYRRAWQEVEQHLAAHAPYDYIIHFGQAGGRGDIAVELGAWNFDSARIPDCDGDKPQEKRICEKAPLFLPSTLPVWQLRDALKRQFIPASLSKDPGGYVCNNLLFKSLHFAEKTTSQTKIGFIHVPYLITQAIHHPGAASVSFESLQKMLDILLDCIEAAD